MKVERRDDDVLVTPVLLPEHDPEGSFRSVLKNRSFLLLWLAQLLSQVGFNAANYGIIALVTAVTHSTELVGLAIVSFTLPAVPFCLLAGVYVDYLNKRMVLWVSNALRAVATGLMVFALLVNSHAIWPIYLLAFFISLVTQFFTPAEASAIPLLVGRRDLVSAISLFNITLTLAQALGFLVLGGLITALVPTFQISLGFTHIPVVSFDVLFAVVAILYIICTLLILAIPRRALHQELSRKVGLVTVFGKETWEMIRLDLLESWSYIRKDRQLLLALLRVSFISVLLLVVGELAGPFVVNVLNQPVGFLPLIFAPAGVGLVLGGVLMPLLTRRFGTNRVIAIGSLSTAAGLLLIPVGRFVWIHVGLAPAGFLFVIAALMFFVGIALDMVNIPAQTIMQEHAPEEERGRIFSFQAMLYNAGSIPVLLFAGAIADILGVETVIILLASTVLGFRLWAARYTHSPIVP
ncbi:MAG TPA: MFS transporter [Ktedonobacteraceae bacterium]|nr:MFS transporter [Ktedonobacteraceae bacterium]